ncbi:MAG: metallophosphoesterase [Candidatus Thorarchaeota archaeon]
MIRLHSLSRVLLSSLVCLILFTATPPFSTEHTSLGGYGKAMIIPDDGVFSFVAYGDTRGDGAVAVSPLHKDIVDLYLQHDPEFIIHTGDMVLVGGEPDQWSVFNDSIQSIISNNTPFYGVVGNHERWSDSNFTNYQDFFDYSDVIDQPGESELHYSFDSGNMHFIFLNTIVEWDGEVFTCPETQMTWLEDEFSQNYEFIVVVLHNPAWSIRYNRPDRWAQAESIRNTFHALFVENGVDLVFTGHDHQYYRTIRDGIQYVVTGGGGAPLYDIQTNGTVWQDGDIGLREYHYCLASIDGELLNVEVFLMNGTVTDSFALILPSTTSSTSSVSTIPTSTYTTPSSTSSTLTSTSPTSTKTSLTTPSSTDTTITTTTQPDLTMTYFLIIASATIVVVIIVIVIKKKN